MEETGGRWASQGKELQFERKRLKRTRGYQIASGGKTHNSHFRGGGKHLGVATVGGGQSFRGQEQNMK